MKRLTYEDEFSIVTIENKETEGDTLEIDSIGNFIEHMVKPLLQGMTYHSNLVDCVKCTLLPTPDDVDYCCEWCEDGNNDKECL